MKYDEKLEDKNTRPPGEAALYSQFPFDVVRLEIEVQAYFLYL